MLMMVLELVVLMPELEARMVVEMVGSARFMGNCCGPVDEVAFDGLSVGSVVVVGPAEGTECAGLLVGVGGVACVGLRGLDRV